MKIEMKKAIEEQIPVWEIAFYDRRETYSSYRDSERYTDKDEAVKRVDEIKASNKLMFEEMLDVYKDYGVTSENYRDCMLWNRLLYNEKLKAYKSTLSDSELSKLQRYFRFKKDSVGYCFINMGMRVEHIIGYEGELENTIGFVDEREELETGVKVYSIEVPLYQSDKNFWVAVSSNSEKSLEEMVRSVVWSDNYCDLEADDIEFKSTEVDMSTYYKPMYSRTIVAIDGCYESYSNIPTVINDLMDKDWHDVGKFRCAGVKISKDEYISIYTYKK